MRARPGWPNNNNNNNTNNNNNINICAGQARLAFGSPEYLGLGCAALAALWLASAAGPPLLRAAGPAAGLLAAYLVAYLAPYAGGGGGGLPFVDGGGGGSSPVSVYLEV